MKYKVLLFDLDGTIAGFGTGIQPENIRKLKQLEAAGLRIAIVSGKPADYLCGFLRQAGLTDPMIAGENGTVIQEGFAYPPKNFSIQSYPEEVKEAIKEVKRRIDAKLPNIWYQPNQVGLTPFTATEEDYELLEQILEEAKDILKDCVVFHHKGCVDIMPAGLDKSLAVEAISRMLGIPKEEMIAVGDGDNDIPMFEAVGYAIGIRRQEAVVDRRVETIEEALEYIETLIKP